MKNKLIAIFCFIVALSPAVWIVCYDVPWPEPAACAVHALVFGIIGAEWWCKP